MKQDFLYSFKIGTIKSLSVLSLFVLVSCAKLSYVIEQAQGQLKLQNRAKDNNVLLKDPSISKEYKEKISEIAKYKKFFYDFFEKKSTSIYSRTTILDRKAVVYLVVASKFYEIKAKKECFPFLGCFPYIGFFNKEKAGSYAKKLENEGYVTTMYPVYAYSTLGFFEDTILSSFFEYDKYDLAELIFHELFHTILFMKNDGELNENLANFFSKELVKIYFSNEKKELQEYIKINDSYDEIKKVIVEKVKILQDKYDKEKPQTSTDASKILNSLNKNKEYNNSNINNAKILHHNFKIKAENITVKKRSKYFLN
ncbi:MAG: aminopeptidase, partial [Oligoflexia bacterium]|nr:aminopeptidase [Oligoflexia bacterium]